MGICQIEILQDTKKAVGYISKYIKKQFSSNNLDDIYLLDGWKREHKIKLVLTSRTPVPKYIYDSIFRKLEKEEKEKFKDLFCDIQNSTKIHIENINSNKVKTKQAIKEELFETYVTKSTKTVTKNDLEIEKKICARTLEEISTKRDFEANINTPIFNLFIQNISHKKLNKTLIKNWCSWLALVAQSHPTKQPKKPTLLLQTLPRCAKNLPTLRKKNITI